MAINLLRVIGVECFECVFLNDSSVVLAGRLMQVGEEFSSAKSESLEESIRRQSLNYFRSYHQAKLDELRMFLENESWELCPVKPSFSIFMLQVPLCKLSELFYPCH